MSIKDEILGVSPKKTVQPDTNTVTSDSQDVVTATQPPVTPVQADSTQASVTAPVPQAPAEVQPGNSTVSPESHAETQPQYAMPETNSGMPQGKGRISLAEMYQQLTQDKPLTKEEVKRKKRDAIFSVIGDGISALSNLYFTTQYAPNIYDPSSGMSAKTKERWDRINAEKQANRKQYVDGYLRPLAMDNENEKDERAWQHQLEREKAADKYAEAENKRKADMEELDRQLKNKNITKADAEAKRAKIQADYENEKQKAALRGLNAKAGAEQARGRASNAQAQYYNSGGGSGSKYYGRFMGNNYKTKSDYDKAVFEGAKKYGVPLLYEEVTERSSKGMPLKSNRVKKNVEDIAAEVTRREAKSREKDTYRRNKKSNVKPPLN